MITIEVRGLVELRAYLDRLRERVLSTGPFLAKIMRRARRYAASISPVVTGSYRRAHRVTSGDMWAELSIDPCARNTRTGVSVSRYAGPVEARHGVYDRTKSYAQRLAVSMAGELGRSLVR